MKFILHEIKLWYNNSDTKPTSYEFLPNKVNVITGDATTGKTSFWSIIDYCLLSGNINIANTISEKVKWYGIRFTINDKTITIARKSPTKGAVSSDVFFDYGAWPDSVIANINISQVKSILDIEFGITDQLRFPFGKELGRTNFNLSYRHFLLFNSLTEDIIGASKTYFDTTFYGKEEYDKALSHIFDMVIGVNDMENIKSKERLLQIENELRKIQWQNTRNINLGNQFRKDLFILIGKCKEKGFIEYSENINSVEEAIFILQNIQTTFKQIASNQNLFTEIDQLGKRQNAIKVQINALKRYKSEYETYKRNLNRCADSLKPIEFLNTNLSDQLLDSYETKIFMESLESSLGNIKKNLSKKVTEPFKVGGDIVELQQELTDIENRLVKLTEIKKNYQTEIQKYVSLGEIKNAFEQLLKGEIVKPIDTNRLNQLNEEKTNLQKIPKEYEQIKYIMKTKLNSSIQRNYNKLKSLTTYKNSRTIFNDGNMVLQLQPEGDLFPLETIGSKSNYMLMHLCFYLGLHEHMISISQEHVPQFLFIDQPSIPYYAGNEGKGNDDKTKLIDAFSLLNSFIDDIMKLKKGAFQILMVEHAPKDYWIDNNLTNFHTVDEFINGKGLIPSYIYNS